MTMLADKRTALLLGKRQSIEVADGVTDDPQELLAQKLAAVLQSEMPKASDVQVSQLVRTSTGLSRENWMFVAEWREHDVMQSRRMLLRRDPAGSLLVTDREREFQVLRALETTSIPAPPVRWVDSAGIVFGSPSMIMDVVEGTCDWFVLNGSRPLEQRLHLARGFMGLLANIQKVDVQKTGLAQTLGDPGKNGAAKELGQWEAEFRRVQLEPLPEMELILDWLRQRAPVSAGSVLVHGDFKPGNALLMGDEITAMLDWETAHLGDPLEDLGWITNPARAREHQIRGVWEREQIVRAYTEATGRNVDPRELLWWNVFSCWKLSVIILTGMHAFVEGTLNRIYHTPVWLFQNMFTLMKEAD